MERLDPPTLYGKIIIEVLLNENDLFYSYVLKINNKVFCRLALDVNANWMQRSGKKLSRHFIDYLGKQIDDLNMPDKPC